MRPTTAQQDIDLQASSYGVWSVVEVQNADATWIRLDTLSSKDWTVTAEIAQDIDRPIPQLTLTIRRDRDGGDSLAPLMEASGLNVDDLSAYAPLLDAGRGVRVSTAVVAAGVTPTFPGDYQRVFDGEIDAVEWGRDPIKVIARNGPGALAGDRFIEARTPYPDSGAAEPVEDTIQDILDDWTGQTLTTIGTPAFNIEPYPADGESVFQAIDRLASLFGWKIEDRWNEAAGGFRLTLYEPDRTATVPDWTLGPEDYFAIQRLAVNRLPIRNAIDIVYQSAGVPTTLSVTDANSIARFGRRFLRITEGSDSPIDTPAEATAFANAILSDLKDPDAELEAEARYLWQLQLGDLLRFTSNGIHFDTNQDLAVSGYRHRLENGFGRTIISLRGKPAGAYRNWQVLGKREELTREDPAPRVENAFLRAIPGTDTTASSGVSEDIRPDADITVASHSPSTGTNLYEVLDETSFNDSDYVTSPDSLSECPTTDDFTFEVGLGNPVGTPADSSEQTMTMRSRFRRGTANAGTADVIVELVQGTTVIASRTHADVGTSFTQFNDVLTNAEVDAISNHNDLRIRVTSRLCSTNELNPISGETSWLELAYTAKTPSTGGFNIDLVHEVNVEVDELDLVLEWNDGGGLTSYSYTLTGVAGTDGSERLQGPGAVDFFMREDWTAFSLKATPRAQPRGELGKLATYFLEDGDEQGAGVKASLTAGGTAVADFVVPGTSITIDTDANGRPRINSSAGGGVSELDDLTDVTITAAATGEFLRYNGSQWVDTTIGVGDLPTINLNDLGDVTITAASTGEFIRYNGSAWVDDVIALGDLPAIALDDLSDVALGVAATGEFLRYNGANWVDALLTASDIPNLDAAKITTGTLADGRISESSVTQHEAAFSIFGIEGLTDPNVNRALYWDDSAGAWEFLDITGDGLTVIDDTTDRLAVSAADGVQVTGGNVQLDFIGLGASTVPIAADSFAFYDSVNADHDRVLVSSMPLHLMDNVTAGFLSSALTGSGVGLTDDGTTVSVDYAGVDNVVLDATEFIGAVLTTEHVLVSRADNTVYYTDVASLPFVEAITAGLGLAGSGTSTVTLDVNVTDGVRINSDAVALDVGGLTNSAEDGLDSLVFYDNSLSVHRRRVINQFEVGTFANSIGYLTAALTASGVGLTDDGTTVSVDYAGTDNIVLDATEFIGSILSTEHVLVSRADNTVYYTDVASLPFIVDVVGGAGLAESGTSTITLSVNAADGVRVTGDNVQLDVGGLTNTAEDALDSLLFWDASASVHRRRVISQFDVSLMDTSGLSTGFTVAGDGLTSPSASTVAVDYAGVDNVVLATPNGVIPALADGDKLLINDLTLNNAYTVELTALDAFWTPGAPQVQPGTFAAGDFTFTANVFIDTLTLTNPLAYNMGGTGLSNSPANDQLLVSLGPGNGWEGSGSGLTWSGTTLTATAFAGDFSGDGSSLTGLTASQIAAGVFPTGTFTMAGTLKVSQAGTVMIRMTNTSNTNLSWDQRVSASGVYEIRSVTDAGATVLNALQIVHATGQMRVRDGSRLLPTFSFGADTNIGLYRLGSNSVGYVGDTHSLVTVGGTTDVTLRFLQTATLRAEIRYADTGDALYIRTGGSGVVADRLGFDWIDATTCRTFFTNTQVYNREGPLIERTTAGSVTLDWDAYNQVDLENDGFIDTINIDDNSMQDGGHYCLIIKYATSGQTSITFSASGTLQWQGGSAPTLPNSTVGDRTIVTFVKTGGITVAAFADFPA